MDTFREAKALAVRAFERSYLLQLRDLYESPSAMARAAGIDRKNLWRLLRKYGLQRRNGTAQDGAAAEGA